jgi:hypothetical protein
MQEPESAPVAIDCPSCELHFDPVADPGEARHLASVHNGLHHGGRTEAAVAVDSESVAVGGTGWPVSSDIYAVAQAQAVPFTGDKTATDRAWSFRVNAAVAGMDVLNPTAVDGWIDTHAAAAEPHLAEAGLVAAWETHVRGLFYTTAIPEAQATDDVDSWDDTAAWP